MAEFPTRPDFESFVYSLYLGILNREPDAVGFQSKVDFLKRGDRSRRQIALEFLSSHEFRKATGMFLSSVDRQAIPNLGLAEIAKKFPFSYNGGAGEASKSYGRRIESGFFQKYFSGEVVLDIGFRGADHPNNETIVPDAIGIDTDFPKYDGITLPFGDSSVDCVSSSHCLEHIRLSHAAIQEWYRVVKIGGFIVCIVPHRDLYEKKRSPPSLFNNDHKHFFTASSLLAMFEAALLPNSYRVRHLVENDFCYDYSIEPRYHATGCYEIELVLEKIKLPNWTVD
jgi:SAM-dependent methyltransferase